MMNNNVHRKKFFIILKIVVSFLFIITLKS